jgi:hypothetical protein
MVLAPEMMIKKMIQTHSTLRFKNLALFSFPGTERERSSLSNPNPNPSPNPNSSSQSLPWIIIYEIQKKTNK